jgi:hypothetical protein
MEICSKAIEVGFMQNIQVQYYQLPNTVFNIPCESVDWSSAMFMHVMVMDYIHIYRVSHESFLITNFAATTYFEVLSDNVHVTGIAH